MDKNIAKRQAIGTKKRRVRARVTGTAGKPRFSVYRSERHIYGQLVDDDSGRTLVSASSLAKDLRDRCQGAKPTEVAQIVGGALAEKALAAGLSQVVFDRNGRRYGGRIKVLADAAREKGLQF